MIAWNTEKDVPPGPETAIIAIEAVLDHREDAQGDGERFLLPDLYRWDVRYGKWMSETGGLLLRQAKFWWLPEASLLETLPCR